MAVKKTTKKKDESAAPTKAEAKETAPKKASRPKAAAKAESATPAAGSTAAPAKKAAAKKAAAPMKLSSSQADLLKKIGEAAEPGYTVGKKVEERSIVSLLEKKLIKKGAKDKASGSVRYLISNTGKKHLTTS